MFRYVLFLDVFPNEYFRIDFKTPTNESYEEITYHANDMSRAGNDQ